MNNFQQLQKMVDEINSTTKSIEKMDILEKYPECKSFLEATYNIYKRYGVKSKSIEERKNVVCSTEASIAKMPIKLYNDFFELLKDLEEETITGYFAIDCINKFINNNAQDYRQLIYNIIDHNLKMRMDVKLINEVFSGLIPTFNVALANDYWERVDLVDFEKEEWFASRKMDGLRCLINTKTGKCYSRSGLEFQTMSEISKEVLKYNWELDWLDGEMCYINEDGLEDFKGIQSQAGRKDYTIPLKNIRYFVFDYLTDEEFKGIKNDRNLLIRYNTLMHALPENILFNLVIQEKVTNKNYLDILLKDAIDKGYEGLIIRKNVPYEGRRVNELLKVKQFFDSEYKVIDVEFKKVRAIKYFKDGKEYWKHEIKDTKDYEAKDAEVEILSKVIVEHKGNRVGVGGGFSQEERVEFKNHPEKLIGKIITVQYKKETQDKDGKFSLQFPVFKCLHGEERVI